MNEIIRIDKQYFNQWVNMGLKLWPGYSEEDLAKEFSGVLQNYNEEGFIYIKNGIGIGFINVSIRKDYVNGSKSSPVGFIEGIYVKAEYRNQGIAKSLVRMGEKWSHARGCIEMGSDILIDNLVSYDFHKKVGFREAERVICFIKDIHS